MSVRIVTPEETRALSGRHAIVIDIRGHEEWRREHIPGARALPLDKIKPGCFREEALSQTDTVIFHCQSGMRTEKSKDQLRASAYPASAAIIEGGINSWKKAGYPVVTDRRQPLPLMRQVQITAGGLALAGTVAGAALNSVFYIIPGFVGAGLMFAGITGWCGMAKLLAVMPWNKSEM